MATRGHLGYGINVVNKDILIWSPAPHVLPKEVTPEEFCNSILEDMSENSLLYMHWGEVWFKSTKEKG